MAPGGSGIPMAGPSDSYRGGAFMRTLRALLPGLLILLPATALAHPGHGSVSGFGFGLLHPVTGIDHVLAMVAVGMLGVQIGGRAIWTLPIAFMSAMLAGAAMAPAGILALPAVELGVLLSVLALGGLIALGRPLPQVLALGLVALFALFHGHAHGAAAPPTADGFLYGLGFVAATGILHAGGIGLGLALDMLGRRGALRYAGLGIVALGVGLGAT
jgi:urease accessory protein